MIFLLIVYWVFSYFNCTVCNKKCLRMRDNTTEFLCKPHFFWSYLYAQISDIIDMNRKDRDWQFVAYQKVRAPFAMSERKKINRIFGWFCLLHILQCCINLCWRLIDKEQCRWRTSIMTKDINILIWYKHTVFIINLPMLSKFHPMYNFWALYSRAELCLFSLQTFYRSL